MCAHVNVNATLFPASSELFVRSPTIRALTSLNVSKNGLVTESYVPAPREGTQVGDLIDGNPVLAGKDRDGEVEILRLDGIKALADSVTNNEALTSLDLARNSLEAGGARQVAVALPKCT